MGRGGYTLFRHCFSVVVVADEVQTELIWDAIWLFRCSVCSPKDPIWGCCSNACGVVFPHDKGVNSEAYQSV